ncbi:hypothetical protein V22_29960 [Calycomorphotria hydatis]|uniref:Uncharacterized protein n=2 Tax=Calycomorphotria hydatis TaxID=2528027 RepID=A0A517TBI7_9PLAN|nr:hypothetical protein V22_29960 [Calycomorphotria hydatis]
MTLILDGLAVFGEIDNTQDYSVSGWIKLKGHDTPMTLNLTGDCGPDLKGRRFRFEAEPGSVEGAELEYPDIAWQQIGPTGSTTLERDDWGIPKSLQLEWFSQNGRVSLTLSQFSFEILEDDDESTEVVTGEDSTDDRSTPELSVGGESASDEEWMESEDEDDPFGLFSDDLQKHFDSEANKLDRLISDDDESQAIREMELMEELIENGRGVPIAEIIDPPLRMPSPDTLNDEEVEGILKTLLARLARHGISLDVCEHFTPRDALMLLVEEICPHELTHPELDAMRWVQHFSTSDFCDLCDEEFEREFEEYERNQQDSDSDDD